MKKWLEKFPQRSHIQIQWHLFPESSIWWFDIFDAEKVQSVGAEPKVFSHYICAPSGRNPLSVNCIAVMEGEKVIFDYRDPKIVAANSGKDVFTGKLTICFNNKNREVVKKVLWWDEGENQEYEGLCNWQPDWLIDDPSINVAEFNKESKTERESIILARVNQGKFRADLFEKFNGKCAVTGVDTPELLVASHILPWAKANNKQRLDPENGLLLSVHYDKLFDRGFISFDDHGKVIVSDDLKESVRDIFSLGRDQQIDVTEESKGYLKFHREMVFRK